MEELKCPGCSSKMEKVKQPDITVDRCSSCGGTFLDKNELNVLATGISGDIEYCTILDNNKHKDVYKARLCPKCDSQKMKKVALLCHGDTIFDLCPKCEGFFLDKGEIGKMNEELLGAAKDNVSEEYRGQKEGYLVRLDRYNSAVLGAYGPFKMVQDACYLKITIYYKKPLNYGLRIFSEKWTDKIAKTFGLFNKQDIKMGIAELDDAFIIQGEKTDKVKAILSNENLRVKLLKFMNEKTAMLSTFGKLEILDNCIIYSEGPYKPDGAKYNVNEDSKGIVKRLLELAKCFDN